MQFHHISKLASALVAAGLLSGAAQAQELTGTLKKIKDSGQITLGVRDSSIPFSYLDDKQSYQGYSIDLCMKVVTAVQKQLGLTALNVKMNPVTSATRIPLMANGTIDLECGSTTNNVERQKQVAFAPTTFVSAVAHPGQKIVEYPVDGRHEGQGNRLDFRHLQPEADRDAERQPESRHERDARERPCGSFPDGGDRSRGRFRDG